MKKYFSSFLTIMFLMLCAACASGGEAKLSLSAQELYQQIQETVSLPSMSSLDQEGIYNLYGVAPEKYTASLFYTSDAPEKGDMILFFEAKDAETAKEIAQAMENDLEQQRNAANNYYREKYALLEGVEPKVDGIYVYAVASENRDTILQVIEKALHQ